MRRYNKSAIFYHQRIQQRIRPIMESLYCRACLRSGLVVKGPFAEPYRGPPP